MCSIMGYCGSSAAYDVFLEGFQRTISRGPDDTRIVDKSEKRQRRLLCGYIKDAFALN